jgi:putative redox protein
MRTVVVSWEPTLERFTAEGTHRGAQIAINAPHAASSHHPPTGFSATELLLAGAGACAAWDALEILRKRRQQVRALDVSVEGEQAPDPPWTYRSLTLHFRVEGSDVPLAVLSRIIRLSIVGYCSVLSTLRGVARIEATIEQVADDGQSSGRRPVELGQPTILAR